MYTTYDIYINFRGIRDRKAYVTDYGSHKYVFFTDNDILKDFGGKFTIEEGKISSHKQPEDYKQLYNSILHQIRQE